VGVELVMLQGIQGDFLDTSIASVYYGLLYVFFN
jgi:hypothetical protein